jgi:hypothetical protein
MTTTWKSGRVAVAALAALAATLGTAGASVRVSKDLTPTTAALNARGKAKLSLKTAAKGKFSVVARHLAPGRSFDVIVGGVKVGSMHTNRGGAGKVKFSTSPRSAETVLGFDPRGDEVVVRDEDGDDDLVGDIPDDSDAAGFACCLPDGDEGEVECEDLAADACSAKGGTPNTATSCLPNPCAGAPEPGGEILCCIPGSAGGAFVDEDPEVECEDVTAAECADAHGTVVSGTSCESSQCAPTPPSAETVCCVPEGTEIECEVRTPENCAAHQGTPSTATSCDGNPCGGSGGGGGGDD